jgi:hypothetical protein
VNYARGRTTSGGVFAVLVIACIISAFLHAGCGPGVAQTVITRSADLSLVQTQGIRVKFHEDRDEGCRAEFPPGSSVLALWTECMQPSYRLDAAVVVADGAARAAQRALDISGADGLMAKSGELLRALGELVDVMIELGMDVPAEVPAIIEAVARILAPDSGPTDAGQDAGGSDA